MSVTVHPQTFGHLEWSEIQQTLANFCQGPIAAERAQQLRPYPAPSVVAAYQAKTSEARALLDAGYTLPVHGVPDVQICLSRAERGGTLDGEELLAIGHIIEGAARCSGYLASLRERCPTLAEVADGIQPIPELGREILDSFDSRGDVANSASGELYDLRQRVNVLHDQLKDMVTNIVSHPDYAGMLQDDYYTIREERYVLPIRSGHKNHVDGIVHGWSGSGATVFIEPQPVVEANNRLVYAHAEVEREVRRILAKLSKGVGRYASVIRANIEALVNLDFAWACGQLSKRLAASAPALTDDQSIVLKAARHPLLVLAGHTVVPNDLTISGDRPVLVLTGPNTGGKTVAMKTLGLCTMMALCGLHVPAAPGSQVPHIPAVLSDIGDEQSLQEHLSTFSGHIRSLRRIFNAIEPGALVLLDELVVGTDPIQGAALAQAILEFLATQGCLVLVTTHYEGLKVLPFNDHRFRNGAMGFEPESGRPTFLLSLDIPGASSALQTAQRLGLPDEVIDRASDLAGPQQQALQAVIESLERERDVLRRHRENAEAEETRLSIARAALEAKERKLADRLQKGLDAEQDQALRDARAVRDELKALRKQVRQKVNIENPEWITQAKQRADEVIEQVQTAHSERAQALAGPKPDWTSMKVGQTVHVVSLGREAELVALPDAKGKCQVRAGIMTIHVNADDLRPRGYAKQVKTSRTFTRPVAKKVEVTFDNAPPQTPDNTVDVRGLRTDDAIERVERFLDTCYGLDRRIVFIVHGHGTGALKKEIRSWLKRSNYVQDQRRGHRTEGGDGVTAALLR
ncbi:MAG: endonuclease MutS2 [Myxococcota bacterium]|nr:endonuclease MutS2 [Myxococcota bacterium]